MARTNNTLVQAFTSDAADRLLSVTRSGSLTVMGSVTGAVATLGVNGRGAALYSDGTFATTNGLGLEDGHNLFVTAGSNAAGALVVSTINKTYLPATVSLAYDLNGNLTNDGLRNFTYNDADELASVSVTLQWKTEFVYDALGRRRIARDYAWQGGGWSQTNETRYVYDGMTVLQERDSANTVKVTYTRGLDLSGSFGGAGGIGGLLASTLNTQPSTVHLYYHADGGGNITALTDSSGNVVGRYLYDPFGTVLGKWGAIADVNVMQFSSMPRHANSGLSLYAFREYDAGLQRWTQRDPIGEWGGVNLYRFVKNNPQNMADSDGRWVFLLALFFLFVSPNPTDVSPPQPPPPVINLRIVPAGAPELSASEDSVVTSDFLNGIGGPQFIGTGMQQPMAEINATLYSLVLPLPKVKCPFTKEFLDASYPGFKYPKWWRNELWERSKRRDGKVYDISGKPIDPGVPWQVGHDGVTLAERQRWAAEHGWSYDQWYEYEHQFSNFRPELPTSNQSHVYERWTVNPH